MGSVFNWLIWKGISPLYGLFEFESPSSGKAKYDAALDEMEKLVTKRKQQDDKKVLDAYHAGDKTADEIVAFIQSEKPKSD